MSATDPMSAACTTKRAGWVNAVSWISEPASPSPNERLEQRPRQGAAERFRAAIDGGAKYGWKR